MSKTNLFLAITSTTPKLLLLAGLLALQGCSQEIDARQARVDQGLIYKKDASDPFTGTLTNVGSIQLGRDYGVQFLPFDGICTAPAKDGLIDGLAVCKNSKGKKIAEIAYSKGHQDGAFKMWASDTDNLMLSMTVHGGFEDGITERYNPKTGKLISRVAYAGGKKSGEEKQWDITGETLLTDLVWENGSQTGVYRYAEREEHYKAGARVGTWKMCNLSQTAPMERRKVNYEKAQAYNAMASQLGGTYFLPALVDEPSGVECTEDIYVNGVKQGAAVATSTDIAPSKSLQDICLDEKITSFHKELGQDAPISNDVLQEMKASCER